MPEGPVIRLPVQLEKIVRHSPMAGPATAGTVSGIVLMSELWTAAIDTTNKWVRTVGATGTGVVASGTSGALVNRRVYRMGSGALADTSRLRSLPEFFSPTVVPHTTSIYKRLVIEWEAAITNLTDHDNTAFLMGASRAANQAREGDFTFGFGLSADALITITDDNGTEGTTAVTGGPTLTNMNKYRIEVSNGLIAFYVNDVLTNSHTTANQLVTRPIQLNFAILAEAAGNAGLDIGAVRAYYLDE